jgi:erythromycin esterase-like protein
MRTELLASEPSVERLRSIVTDLLTFLASRKGRTDSNVRFVDYGLSSDDDVWDRVELVEANDPILADVLRDMAGALHDTVKAPHIARNFDSTPEQLLARLGSPAHGA